MRDLPAVDMKEHENEQKCMPMKMKMLSRVTKPSNCSMKWKIGPRFYRRFKIQFKVINIYSR